MSGKPRRGEIYVVDFDPTRGSEQGGRRPALIVSNDVANASASPIVTVVPLTHTIPKKNYPQNVNIPVTLLDQQGGTIFCGQILTVSKERLGNFHGTLPMDMMDAVDEALRIHLALPEFAVDP